MTREQAAKLLPVIQAFAEGKSVEWWNPFVQRISRASQPANQRKPMIKIVSVYATSDGSTFQSEDAAKACEINLLAGSGEIKNSCADDSTGAWVVSHAAEIIAILTSKPDAPPKRRPRSDKGKNHAKRNTVPAKEGVA